MLQNLTKSLIILTPLPYFAIDEKAGRSKEEAGVLRSQAYCCSID
jgi:hypothetical protein